jgi:ASPIC and UnbV/FG-GAP-like repeat
MLYCRHAALTLTIASLSLPLASSARATFTEQGATVLGGLNVSGRSVSMADIDNDGDLDLFFQGAGTSSQKLMRNNIIGTGAFTFTDITSTMIPAGLSESWSAAWGDYDGDGLIDVFVGQANAGSNTGDLLKNNGAAGFSNVSVATGLNDPGFHQNVAWADFDHDRDLDLIIGMEGPDEKHQMYLQGPASQFTPVGAAVGIQVPVGTKAYGMAIGDTDGDGDLDIFLSTCRGDNNIRKNFFQNMLAETGTLGFVDIADDNGTQTYKNGYGAEFVDFDDDGDLDLYMAGADAQPTKIWRNDGGNMFIDVDTITGHPLLSDPAGDLDGARAVDYDNDGDLDLYFHNNAAGTQARKLYRNDGDWKFTDVTVAAGVAGGIEGGYDSAWGDIDLDGDQDLIVPNNMGSIAAPIPEHAFINDASTNGNHWLYLRLHGPADNTTGLGASLYATIDEGTLDERTIRREANTNAGTFNQSDLPVHFGLGGAELIDQLRVVWPDGTVQFLQDVAVDQYLTIDFPTPLAGDYNTDGIVDAADYTVWRNHLGSGVSLPNDTTPGVGQDDYTRWKINFGATTAGSAAVSAGDATIPEPSVATLLAICLAILGMKPRRMVR